MKTKPTEVKFDEKSYAALQEEFEQLETKCDNTSKALHHLQEITKTFFEKLGQVALVEGHEVIATSTDYEIWVEAGGMSDRPRIKIRKHK